MNIIIIIVVVILVVANGYYNLTRKTTPEIKASTTTIDPTNSQYNIFTSYNLGIIYRYPKVVKNSSMRNALENKVLVTEENNRLYIDLENGENYFVEFYTKDKDESFEDAIKNRFIPSKSNCSISNVSESTIYPVYFIKSPGQSLEVGANEEPKAECGPYSMNYGYFIGDKNSNRYYYVQTSGREYYFGIPEVQEFWPPRVDDTNLKFIE